MINREVILYIAQTLDGYIATDNDDISFLSMVERPGEDYGYNDFIKKIDTVIMGRKAYDKVLTFEGAFPHRDKKCYVLSRTKKGSDKNVEFYNGDIKHLITNIRQKEGKNIFIDGGAELVFELMKEKLIDKFIISIIPHLLGSGKQLFKSGRPSQNIKFVGSKTFPSGLVQLEYVKHNIVSDIHPE